MKLNRICELRGWRKAGYQITELGPALIILFVFIFFPIMNLFYIAFAYADGWFLNQTLAREVSCTPPVQPIGSGTYQFTTPYSSASFGTVFPNAPGTDLDNQVQAKLDTFLSMGLAKFLRVTPASTSNWIYQHVITNPNAPPAVNIVDYSVVTTVLTIQPFLPIPMYIAVPGLNTPFQYKFSTQLLQEEKGLN